MDKQPRSRKNPPRKPRQSTLAQSFSKPQQKGRQKTRASVGGASCITRGGPSSSTPAVIVVDEDDPVSIQTSRQWCMTTMAWGGGGRKGQKKREELLYNSAMISLASQTHFRKKGKGLVNSYTSCVPPHRMVQSNHVTVSCYVTHHHLSSNNGLENSDRELGHLFCYYRSCKNTSTILVREHMHSQQVFQECIV